MKFAALTFSLLLVAMFHSSVPAQQALEKLQQADKSGLGLELSGRDLTVHPGDDFYLYANGEWLRRAHVPTDRTVIGSFPDLRYNADERVKRLLEDESTSDSEHELAKARMLYRSFLDQATVERLGSAPIQARLSELHSVQSKAQIGFAMGKSFAALGGSLYQMDFAYDRKDPKHYAIYIGQGGLGLPDRDYYLQSEFRSVVEAYQGYICQTLNMVHWANSEDLATQIVRLESSIAEGSWSRGELRDMNRSYRKSDLQSLERNDPGFPWRSFINGAGVPSSRKLILTTDSSVKTLAQIFKATPLQVLKAWSAFRLIDSSAPYLSSDFSNAYFAFHQRTLAGQNTIAPRWARGTTLLNQTMGSAVGKAYTEHYLNPQSISDVNEIVRGLRSVLQARLACLPWMNEATRSEALRKLSNLRVQVGRPAHWIDYSNLTVRRNDLYGNVERARAFDWNRRLRQSEGMWNESDWRFWPQYPTAYTENNNLIFTAAMLQSPFFDPEADDAVNFGGIGAVIGHEITHSFDDQGRQEDSQERLRDWWAPEDAQRFLQRASILTKQFSAIEPIQGSYVQGDVTLGENIADLGGVTIAYEAYEKAREGKEPALLDGYTGEQRFFLSWAQIWREKWNDAALRKLLATDVHSPGVARVNGILRNLQPWYAAFGVQKQSTLFLEPQDRVAVW